MKRQLSLFLVLLSIGMGSQAATTVDVDSLRYTLNDDGSATLTECLFKSTPEITIPSTITSGGTTYTVKYIGQYAFDQRKFITSVTFPNTLEKMAFCSFRWCTALKSVNIPASLKEFSSSNFSECWSLETVTIAAGSQMTKVDEAAFYNCKKLTSINLPNTITEIMKSAFYHCESLPSITLPTSLATIGTSVFEGCRALQTVNNFENTPVTAIPNATFNGCYALESVTLPSTVTSIGDYAFSECKALPSITLPSGVTSIGYRGFFDCEALISITLPSSLNTIGQDAFAYCKSMQKVNNFENTQLTTMPRAVFYGCEALTSITFPPTLKQIGDEVFRYCKAMESINLSSLETAGEYVFANCGLKSVVIPQSMKTVPRDFLSYCDQLESVTLPEGLTTLARGVFYEDDLLDGVVLPSTLTTIGSYAFGNCKGLTSITIPANVTVIDEYAFQYCEQLETVDMKPTTMTTIGRNAFDVCKKLKSFRVPEGITTLGQSVFWGCESLQELTLPSTLTTIGIRLCYNCNSLTSINIPSKVTSIGDDAFNRCKQLDNITLPASLTSLGSYAFANCENAESVTFLGNGDVTLTGESQFSTMKNLKSVKLPDNLSTITRSMFYGCEKLEAIDLSKLPATEIRPYAFYSCKALSSAQLPPSLASIGECAFNNCNNLTTIAFPTTLKTIGNDAFRYTSLTTLQLNNGLETIGNYAFANCAALTTATFPNTLTSLGQYALDNCGELLTVVFPKNLTTLPRSVCGTCKKLQSVTFPENLETISQYAFYEANSLQSLALPQTLQNIEYAAFYNTKSLGALTLPTSVKTVGDEAFHYSMMPSLTLNEGLEAIGKNAFRECDRLKEVTLPSTIKSLGHAAFWTCDSLRTLTFAENMPDLTFSGDSHFGHNAQLVKVTLPKTGLTTMTDYMFKDCDRLRNIELPATITSIGYQTFQSCDSLQTIYIPDGVKSIGTEAFCYCRGLHYVRLPEGLETIGGSCFAYTDYLQYINVPSTVTSIGNYAFHTTANSSNTNFKSIGIMGSTMPETNDHVFWQYQPAFSMLVPAGQEEAYQSSTSWTPDAKDNRTIKGYPAEKQTLTQDLIHLSCLNKETYRTGSPEAVYVDWFEGMGNYQVFYTDKKGNKTSVTPVDGGEYTISLVFEEGPYYKPATFNNVATFNLQEIADEDFALLWDFYSKTYDWTKQKSTWTGNGGGGAKANWQLIEGVKESAANIFGVKWNNGHVEEINMGAGTSIYNLNANETPVSLFALPKVKKIDMQGVEFYGNISDKVEAWLASGKTLSPTLEYLDLERNKLEGNIATLANNLPALKLLDVHENRFSTIYPELPASLENINISNQTITDIVATVDLRDMTESGFFSTLPSIVFYDPATRTYAEDISISVKSQTNWSSFNLNYVGDNDFNVTGTCTWKGASGDEAQCSYTDSKNKTTSFNAIFLYDMGDVDFNGQVNVLDLQQSINYLFKETAEGYNWRYNFTAGDLLADNAINVLDVVRHVDLLLSQNKPTTTEAKARKAKAVDTSAEEAEAKMYVENGQLQLQTNEPVAAIDMTLSAADAERISWISHTGMTTAQKTLDDGRVHIIIYSAAGKTLPTGKTTLAANANDGNIDEATLVNAEARVIQTALNDADAPLVTSIESVENEQLTDDNWYTIDGRKLPAQPVEKGVYIVNGKKVIIK